LTSDEQQQSFNAIESKEESLPSSIILINERQDDHEIISPTTESSIDKSELPLQSQQPETTIDQEVKF
jgi:hypothetical protein